MRIQFASLTVLRVTILALSLMATQHATAQPVDARAALLRRVETLANQMPQQRRVEVLNLAVVLREGQHRLYVNRQYRITRALMLDETAAAVIGSWNEVARAFATYNLACDPVRELPRGDWERLARAADSNEYVLSWGTWSSAAREVAVEIMEAVRNRQTRALMPLMARLQQALWRPAAQRRQTPQDALDAYEE